MELEELKRRIKKKVDVFEIIVFGSRARGEADRYSDLDLLVVVEGLDRETEKYISDCAWEVGFPAEIVIMPIIVTRDQLVNSPIRESVFIKNVYQDGVSI
jgi:uncharacterized protein